MSLNQQNIANLLDKSFTGFLTRYGIDFMRCPGVGVLHNTELNFIMVPLMVNSQCVASIVVNDGDNPQHIEDQVYRLVRLIRDRQACGELGGFILGQDEPKDVPKLFPKKSRRIKVSST